MSPQERDSIPPIEVSLDNFDPLPLWNYLGKGWSLQRLGIEPSERLYRYLYDDRLNGGYGNRSLVMDIQGTDVSIKDQRSIFDFGINRKVANAEKATNVSKIVLASSLMFYTADGNLVLYFDKP
jgi:hypothetical protein